VTAALIAWTLKASLILLAAFGVTRLMRRASAAARHLVWTLALAGVLVLPLLGAVLPAWHVRALPELATPAPPASPAPAAVPAFKAIERRSDAVPAGSARYDIVPQSPSIDWVRLLPFLWTAGAALVLVRLLAGLAGVWWLGRRAHMMTDARWLHAAHSIASRLGLGRGVTLLQGDRGTVPMTWGVLQPVVWLPADAETWDDERRTVVLAHELAHVRRRDALTQWIAHLALAANWFNPLAWIAMKRFRDERERACDDAVIGLGTQPTTYADHLLDIVRSHGAAGGPMPAMAMARRSQFEGRLLAILDGGSARRGIGARGALWVGALAMTAVFPIAAIRGTAPRPASRASTSEPSVSKRPAGATAPAADAGRPTPPASPAPSASRPPTSRDTLLHSIRTGTSDSTLRRVIAATASMTNDGDRADVLRAVLRHPKLDRADMTALLAATQPMTTDGDRSDVLRAAIPRVSFDDAAQRTAFFEAVSRFVSDGNRKDVLSAAFDVAPLGEPAVRAAFITAIAPIVSDGDKGDLLVRLLGGSRLDPAALVDVIRSTHTIASDGDKTRVLMEAIRHQRLDDGARAAIVTEAQSIASDGDRGTVLQALLPGGETSSIPVAGGSGSRGRSEPVVATTAEARVVNGSRRWTTDLSLNGTHGGNPSYEVRITARKALVSADARHLVGFEPGGSLSIEHTVHPDPDNPGVTTTLTRTATIRPAAGGRFSYDYRIDGAPHPWDDAAPQGLDLVVARWAGGQLK
jgi:beta-lactamase regulating signal transducer with metallopeptidase domain